MIMMNRDIETTKTQKFQPEMSTSINEFSQVLNAKWSAVLSDWVMKVGVVFQVFDALLKLLFENFTQILNFQVDVIVLMSFS